MPSADFCGVVRIPCEILSPVVRRFGLAYLLLRLSALECLTSLADARQDTSQISRGKFDRLPCTTAGFTLPAFDGYALRRGATARAAMAPHIRFLYIGSQVCSTLPSDPASRQRPCVSLTLHLHQVE